MKRAILILTAILMICSFAAGETVQESFRDGDFIYADFISDVSSIPYSEALNEAEQELDDRLRAMKMEADGLFGELDEYGIIQRGNDAMLNSGLYRFCLALPKGGELHTHQINAIPFDRLMNVIREEAMICLEEGEKYGYLYERNNPDQPEGTVPLSRALEEGRITEDSLYSMILLEEADRPDNFWKAMNKSSAMLKGLYTDEELYVRIYEEQFRSCRDNGVELVELRMSMKDNDEENTVILNRILEAYGRVRKEDPDFTVRVIACSGKDEKYTHEKVRDTFSSAIRLSKIILDGTDPDNPQPLIIGLDLVNEEDRSKALSEYEDIFLSEEVRESGLKNILHCGESLKLDSVSVIDAFLFDAYRVGHGLNLYRYPMMMDLYRDLQIAVEVCPISNHRLGYVYDLRLHPALYYLRTGIPVVICSDDGLFMTQNALVDDFFAAILCWDLNLGDIKALCRNSIIYSGLPEPEVRRLMSVWEAQWDAFVAGFW